MSFERPEAPAEAYHQRGPLEHTIFGPFGGSFSAVSKPHFARNLAGRGVRDRMIPTYSFMINSCIYLSNLNANTEFKSIFQFDRKNQVMTCETIENVDRARLRSDELDRDLRENVQGSRSARFD